MPGEQVIQGQHRVRLAAAEIGLQFDDRIPPCPQVGASPPIRSPLQAFGEEGAAEELGRIAYSSEPSPCNLPEVGGELGLLVATGGHVRMWSDDFPPGLQPPCLAFDRCPRSLPALATRMLVENERRSSILIRSTSSACGADTAVSSRAMESSARSASSLLEGS